MSLRNTIQSVKKYWNKIKSIQAKAADAVLCSWATQDSLIIPKYLYSLRCKNNSMRTWQHWGTIWWTRVQTKEGTNKTPNHFISDTAETGWRNKNWPEVNSSIDASTPSTRIIKRKLWKPHFILLSTNNCIKKRFPSSQNQGHGIHSDD